MSEQPVISFVVHEVRAGRAGAGEDFEQMVGLLVRTTTGQSANLVLANPGDWGIDVLVGDLHGRVTVWQTKYFPQGVGRSQLAQIRESFTAALRAAAVHGYALDRWVLCIPSSMDGPTTQWWHNWKAEQERTSGVVIELWDEAKLRELLLRPEAANVYRHYYAPYLTGWAGRAVSFAEHEVRAGLAGASEDFEQMLGLLVRATSGEASLVFAKPGDWGIDVLVGDLRGQATVWQAKYFTRGVGRSQRAQITGSFDSAVRAAAGRGYVLERWVLCIPSSMDGPTTQWWHAWKAGQERDTDVIIELWDETSLRELLLRPEAADVRRHYYAPYLQTTAGGVAESDTTHAPGALHKGVNNERAAGALDEHAVGHPPGGAKPSGSSPTEPGDVNCLTVVELGHGADMTFRFELRSPALGILASFDSKPLRNRADYITSIYQEIENRWITSSGDADAFQEELREFGGSLFSELFPEPLQEILWREKDRLPHLMVVSEEPFIPWELAHLKEPGGALPDETRFMAELGLVRWLYTRDNGYPPLTLHARPGRVRVLRPDYPRQDLRLPQTLLEARFLLDRLGAAPVDPTEHDVRELLRTGGFDILHFAGHGIADSANIANARILLQGRLESGSYIPAYLKATTVAQQARLADSDGSKPLIVLNACQAGRLGQQMSSLGGFAPAFLDRGAGAFISTMWSVGDAPATTFIQTMYEELLHGRPISAAAVKARHKARLAGDGTWLAYAVYAHPHARLAP